MKFIIGGVATIGFTQVVEADSQEEAVKKVHDMRVVDMSWDYEEIEVIDEITEVSS